jgi:hypothetical protein
VSGHDEPFIGDAGRCEEQWKRVIVVRVNDIDIRPTDCDSNLRGEVKRFVGTYRLKATNSYSFFSRLGS